MSEFHIGDIVIVKSDDWYCKSPIAIITDVVVVTDPNNKSYYHEYCFVSSLPSRRYRMLLLSERLKYHYINDFQDKIEDSLS